MDKPEITTKDWVEYYDEASRSYYMFNEVTGESKWKDDTSLVPTSYENDRTYPSKSVATTPSCLWEPYIDTNGNTYYYNCQTGETAWTIPDGEGGGRELVESKSKALQRTFKRAANKVVAVCCAREEMRKAVGNTCSECSKRFKYASSKVTCKNPECKRSACRSCASFTMNGNYGTASTTWICAICDKNDNMGTILTPTKISPSKTLENRDSTSGGISCVNASVVLAAAVAIEASHFAAHLRAALGRLIASLGDLAKKGSVGSFVSVVDEDNEGADVVDAPIWMSAMAGGLSLFEIRTREWLCRKTACPTPEARIPPFEVSAAIMTNLIRSIDEAYVERLMTSQIDDNDELSVPTNFAAFERNMSSVENPIMERWIAERRKGKPESGGRSIWCPRREILLEKLASQGVKQEIVSFMHASEDVGGAGVVRYGMRCLQCVAQNIWQHWHVTNCDALPKLVRKFVRNTLCEQLAQCGTMPSKTLYVESKSMFVLIQAMGYHRASPVSVRKAFLKLDRRGAGRVNFDTFYTWFLATKCKKTATRSLQRELLRLALVEQVEKRVCLRIAMLAIARFASDRARQIVIDMYRSEFPPERAKRIDEGSLGSRSHRPGSANSRLETCRFGKIVTRWTGFGRPMRMICRNVIWHYEEFELLESPSDGVDVTARWIYYDTRLCAKREYGSHEHPGWTTKSRMPVQVSRHWLRLERQPFQQCPSYSPLPRRWLWLQARESRQAEERRYRHRWNTDLVALRDSERNRRVEFVEKSDDARAEQLSEVEHARWHGIVRNSVILSETPEGHVACPPDWICREIVRPVTYFVNVLTCEARWDIPPRARNKAEWCQLYTTPDGGACTGDVAKPSLRSNANDTSTECFERGNHLVSASTVVDGVGSTSLLVPSLDNLKALAHQKRNLLRATQARAREKSWSVHPGQLRRLRLAYKKAKRAYLAAKSKKEKTPSVESVVPKSGRGTLARDVTRVFRPGRRRGSFMMRPQSNTDESEDDGSDMGFGFEMNPEDLTRLDIGTQIDEEDRQKSEDYAKKKKSPMHASGVGSPNDDNVESTSTSLHGTNARQMRSLSFEKGNSSTITPTTSPGASGHRREGDSVNLRQKMIKDVTRVLVGLRGRPSGPVEEIPIERLVVELNRLLRSDLRFTLAAARDEENICAALLSDEEDEDEAKKEEAGSEQHYVPAAWIGAREAICKALDDVKKQFASVSRGDFLHTFRRVLVWRPERAKDMRASGFESADRTFSTWLRSQEARTSIREEHERLRRVRMTSPHLFWEKASALRPPIVPSTLLADTRDALADTFMHVIFDTATASKFQGNARLCFFDFSNLFERIRGVYLSKSVKMEVLWESLGGASVVVDPSESVIVMSSNVTTKSEPMSLSKRRATLFSACSMVKSPVVSKRVVSKTALRAVGCGSSTVAANVAAIAANYAMRCVRRALVETMVTVSENSGSHPLLFWMSMEAHASWGAADIARVACDAARQALVPVLAHLTTLSAAQSAQISANQAEEHAIRACSIRGAQIAKIASEYAKHAVQQLKRIRVPVPSVSLWDFVEWVVFASTKDGDAHEEEKTKKKGELASSTSSAAKRMRNMWHLLFRRENKNLHRCLSRCDRAIGRLAILPKRRSQLATRTLARAKLLTANSELWKVLRDRLLGVFDDIFESTRTHTTRTPEEIIAIAPPLFHVNDPDRSDEVVALTDTQFFYENVSTGLCQWEHPKCQNRQRIADSVRLRNDLMKREQEEEERRVRFERVVEARRQEELNRRSMSVEDERSSCLEEQTRRGPEDEEMREQMEHATRYKSITTHFVIHKRPFMTRYRWLYTERSDADCRIHRVRCVTSGNIFLMKETIMHRDIATVVLGALRKLQAYNSPHIQKIHDLASCAVGKCRHRVVVVFHRVEGDVLGSKTSEGWNNPEATRFAKHLVEAIYTLHKCGLYHGQLDSSRICLPSASDRAQILVFDFKLHPVPPALVAAGVAGMEKGSTHNTAIERGREERSAADHSKCVEDEYQRGFRQECTKDVRQIGRIILLVCTGRRRWSHATVHASTVEDFMKALPTTIDEKLKGIIAATFEERHRDRSPKGRMEASREHRRFSQFLLENEGDDASETRRRREKIAKQIRLRFVASLVAQAKERDKSAMEMTSKVSSLRRPFENRRTRKRDYIDKKEPISALIKILKIEPPQSTIQWLEGKRGADNNNASRRTHIHVTVGKGAGHHAASKSAITAHSKKGTSKMAFALSRKKAMEVTEGIGERGRPKRPLSRAEA